MADNGNSVILGSENEAACEPQGGANVSQAVLVSRSREREVLRMVGKFDLHPGRLFSFVAEKPVG